jgi:predicted oxidoreductase
VSNFLDSVSDLLQHILRNCNDSNMVEVSINNEVSVQDKAFGISFRWKELISVCYFECLGEGRSMQHAF